jgi:phage-related protein
MPRDTDHSDRKPLNFITGALDELRELPHPVRDAVGDSLDEAQWGRQAPNAFIMKDNLREVTEIVVDYDKCTYRGYYAIMPRVIYFLYAFNKKSRSGRSTPQSDLALIERRLKTAKVHYAEDFRE